MDKPIKISLDKMPKNARVERIQGPKLFGKQHAAEIEEHLNRQAKIEQLSRGGEAMDVHAWANVCPDCDVVTEYRALHSEKYRFGFHGPVAEAALCGDCNKAREDAALAAEMDRLSKLTNEEIEAEQKEKLRKETVITREYVDAQIEKGGNQKDILKLINNVGRTFGEMEKK